jgi:hypothetical protein
VRVTAEGRLVISTPPPWLCGHRALPALRNTAQAVSENLSLVRSICEPWLVVYFDRDRALAELGAEG